MSREEEIMNSYFNGEISNATMLCYLSDDCSKCVTCHIDKEETPIFFQGGKKNMTKRTKALRFSEATALKIVERDEMCIFCKSHYHMESTNTFDYQIQDIMHIVNKSQGGLGIEQNGALGCRYHHHLLDNGNKGLRDEMIHILEEYIKRLYPGWDREKLVYKKEV